MARIAIVGSGISGLSCADILLGKHDVVVFESAHRAGGHARSMSVDGVAVDTGFIVYNEVNYPLLTRFFASLGVMTKPSDMSFGFHSAGGELEYAAGSIRGLLAQPKNLLSPAYWSMLRDIWRFFRVAPSVLQSSSDPTLKELLYDMAFGKPFRDNFLIPMGAAIWSTPPDQMLAFPAKTFIRFFENHGLLSVTGHHPWRTVAGGSETYVAKITDRLGARLRLSSPVDSVSASNGGLIVRTAAGALESFDDVIFACHADEALRLLRDATDDERSVLSAFAFQNNTAVLHTDERLMPRAKRAWASWNYSAPEIGEPGPVSLTYWMNRLQSLPGPNIFVTLNPQREISPSLVRDIHVFRHPVFSHATLAAQQRIGSIQGRRNVWFCGAWQRYGFHEDGIWSAHRVARELGGTPSWA